MTGWLETTNAPAPGNRLPAGLTLACRQQGLRLSRHVLTVNTSTQRMTWHERRHSGEPFRLRRQFRVSTSRFGPGQRAGSYQTPLGLHRVAAKIGAGWPPGTVFKARQPVGYTWQGRWEATIVHRILWLEGLEPGYNRGGAVDTLARFIYLHGFGDETTLGRPHSHGCVHLAARDLMPLFDLLPVGTLVWITPGWRFNA